MPTKEMEELEKAKKIMFWSETYAPKSFMGDRKFVNERTPDQRVNWLVVAALRAPEYKLGYRGWANCRICGCVLGTHDFVGYGYAWPERAEHYVIVHDVMIPELMDLVRQFQEDIWARERVTQNTRPDLGGAKTKRIYPLGIEAQTREDFGP